MKKYDNFLNSLAVLKGASPSKAVGDDIYRMGIIGQFNLTFETAWKAAQSLLRFHAVNGAETGSPREILKLAFANGFIHGESAWLAMMTDRNRIAHIYDGAEADKIIQRVFSDYIPAFEAFAALLKTKYAC